MVGNQVFKGIFVGLSDAQLLPKARLYAAAYIESLQERAFFNKIVAQIAEFGSKVNAYWQPFLDKVKNTLGQWSGGMLDNALIADLEAHLSSIGSRMNKGNLKFVAINNDNLIMFLEKGTPSSGLQHIIDGKWTGKPNFQALFNNNIDEMVENMFKAIKDGNYTEKIIDNQNRLSYIYKVQITQGPKEFIFATGSNGYIVSFIPNWL